MARNPKFDQARRRLDEALRSLDGLAASEPPRGAGQTPGPEAGPAPASTAAAAAPATRVAPRRRTGAVPLRSTARPDTPRPQPGAPPGPSAQALTPIRLGAVAIPPPGEAQPVGLDTPYGQPVLLRAPEGADSSPTMVPLYPEEDQQPHAPHAQIAPPHQGRGAAMPDLPALPPALASDEPGRPPAPTTQALVRLLVGAALLGLDGLTARSDNWEAAAGIERDAPAPAAAGEIGSGRFRHALIGWLFEAEERLRPRGNPIRWLREVVAYLFGTVFSVIFELLPLPRLGFRRSRGSSAEPTDEDTLRWIERGALEEQRTRAFAQAAIEDIAHHAILYLARRPAVQGALAELVRSPAMDDAVSHIVNGPVIEQAIARVAESPALDQMITRVADSPALDQVISKVADSPALDQAVTKIVHSPALEEAVGHIVRTPAMEDAVKYLVGTEAMSEAIDTLAQSPALVELVTTQSTSVAAEILEEVRERAVSGDRLVEGIARRILRRQPRSALPPDTAGILMADTLRPSSHEPTLPSPAAPKGGRDA